MNSEKGFTLIELMIVVALILLLACLALPNLVAAMDKGKRNVTVANIRQVGQALEAYAIEHNEYPRATSMEELAAVLEPEFLKSTPLPDGWGHPLLYECEANGQVFTIPALGKDGSRQGSGLAPDDIVFADGRFILGPEDEKS